jgi:hypothetical protein
MILPPCEKCGKNTFTSTSGLTLHKNQCKGPKTPKVRKTNSDQPVAIEAPDAQFFCEGEGEAGASACGELADYRMVYVEDEVEAFAYACKGCKDSLKKKYNPTKIIKIVYQDRDTGGILSGAKKVEPKKPKYTRLQQEVIDEFIEYANEHWRKAKHTKDETQLLHDLAAEVKKIPGTEVTVWVALMGGWADW